MQIDDVLYTPLDCPPMPDFDMNKLKDWMTFTYSSFPGIKDFLSNTGRAAEDRIADYPWDITPAYFNPVGTGPGWINSFDKQFPELAKFSYEAFNVPIEDLGMVLFLPIRANHTGLGFWHNDMDPYGMRMYLEFEDMEQNKLLMRRTKISYTDRANLPVPITEEFMQSEVIECKLLHRKQCFFLNNIRAVHSTYTEVPNKTRIAAFITGRFGKHKRIRELINDLVVRSAEKYSDYAVLWKPDDVQSQ